MKSNDELFAVSRDPTYDTEGMRVDSINSLFAYIFREVKNLNGLMVEMDEIEKVRTIKRYIDGIEYDKKVAIAGLRRESRDKERLQQLKLL